jgi:hypothetical protein
MAEAVRVLAHVLAVTPRFAKAGNGCMYVADMATDGLMTRVSCAGLAYSFGDAEAQAKRDRLPLIRADFEGTAGDMRPVYPVTWDEGEIRRRVQDGSSVRYRALGVVVDGGKTYRCDVEEHMGGRISVVLRHLGEKSRGHFVPDHYKPEARAAVLVAYNIARANRA